MRRVGATILLVVAAIALPSVGSAQKKKLYQWRDANGQIHFSETVPPEAANRDRVILNNQGVHVGFEEGEVTPEEASEAQERETAANADKQAKEEIARHDRMLLQTYISVADIEDVRDRRLELKDSQIKLTETSLGNLRKKLVDLQTDASSFKPYSTRADAPQIPEVLARDISQTTSSITSYEQNLASTSADRAALKKSFDDDIVRFRELKGE